MPTRAEPGHSILPASPARRRWAIIADDLTGAADTGVKFAWDGHRVSISLARKPWETDLAAEHLVLDTDSRAVSEVDARRRVRDAVLVAQQWRPTDWFKKVDSTMQGHVAVEIEAFLDEIPLPDALAVLCPAVPNHGRIVQHGSVSSPHRKPYDILGMLHRSPLTAAHLAEGHDGPALNRRLQGLGTDVRVAVVDSTDGIALRAVAEAVLIGGARPLIPIGSAGLAGALAAVCGPRAGGHLPVPPGPAVLVLGSQNPLTRTQAQRVAEASGWPVLPVGPCTDLAAVVSAVNSATSGLVLLADADGKGAPGLSERIERALADCAAGCLQATRDGWLLVSGGATARAVLDRLGAEGVQLLGELSDGIPLGRISLADGPGPLIATKAGGFGKPRTLAGIFAQQPITSE